MYFYFLHRVVFPYDLVKQGKLPFTFKELDAFLKDPDVLYFVFAHIILFSLLTIFLDTLKWLIKKQDNICEVIVGGLSFTFMIILGIYLFMASSHVFLTGLGIQTKELSFFPHEKAEMIHQLTNNF